MPNKTFRKYKKKFYRRAKKFVKKDPVKYAKTTKCLFRFNATVLQNAAGGGGPLPMAVLLDFPGWYNLTGIDPQRLSYPPQQFNRYFNLFDEYHVDYVRVTMTSPYNQTWIGMTQGVGPTGNNYYPIVHTGYDYDDQSVCTSIRQMQSLVKYRTKNFLNGKITLSMFQKDKVRRNTWLNTGTLSPLLIPVQNNTITNAIPSRGSIKTFMENAPQGSLAYDLKAEWMVRFRGERTDTPVEELFIQDNARSEGAVELAYPGVESSKRDAELV